MFIVSRQASAASSSSVVQLGSLRTVTCRFNSTVNVKTPIEQLLDLHEVQSQLDGKSVVEKAEVLRSYPSIRPILDR